MLGEVHCLPEKNDVGFQLKMLPGLHLPGRVNVESIGAAMASELTNRAWGYSQALAGLMQYLVCLLIRRLDRSKVVSRHDTESPAIVGDPRIWDIIKRAVEYCDAHFRQKLTHAEVGKLVGYSSRYLSQLMSSYLGHTLADHLQNLRIREGQRLLEETDLAIGTIANTVGYEDPAHFTRAFKRAVGVTPRVYRQRFSLP
jgi:transcriptional regulator GlxA family with amidase domain